MTNKSFEIIIKKSRFISYVFPIKDKNEIKPIIAELAKENKKARHICYAYRLIIDGVENAGFNDDGEPKHTAGKPIYDILRIKELDNVLVVVIRYFGGIMLGAGGLTRAYRESAKIAIEDYIKQ